jgi:hypothetical protein
MGWFKVSEDRVVYAGRITRDPFAAWLATKPGSATVAEAAKSVGFRLFGRARAARKQLWRELEAAARSEDGRAALQAAADIYTRGISSLAYAQGLPRITVALRRLVLIPRALAAGRARSSVHSRLVQCEAFAALRPPVQEFFFERVMLEADAAARLARPSIKRPIASSEEWSLVGADTAYQWVDQLWSGAGWTGHWFVHERPRAALSRADRRALEEAMASLRSSIATLPRERRHALIKLAAN